MKDTYRQIFRLIKSFDQIIIARHIGPDPDAIASQIALRDSIKLTFPEKKVYAVGAGVSRFRYLGSLDKPDYSEINKALLIVLDVPNFIRVDGIEGLNYSKIVKIDHHPKEDIIGDVDFTSSDYSSTAEMVCELIYNTKLLMDKTIAENLFMGIISDSERFLFKNTTPNTIEVALRIIKDYKLDFTSLYDNLYSRNFSEYKFKAYIINNLNITNNKFGYLIIDNNVINELGVDLNMASILINEFNFINELLCWCFVTYDERNKIYKVNIRSRGPIINEVASKFNGGGHNFAAGARITKKSSVDDLISALDDACKEYVDKEES